MRRVDPIKAYEILQQRMINEDRIIVERTNLFLVSSSFLFIAFVTLVGYIFTYCHLQKTPLVLLLYVLPVVGMFLSLLLYHFNTSATNILAFWHGALLKLEENSIEFDIMRRYEIKPHRDGHKHQQGDYYFDRDSGQLKERTKKWDKWEYTPPFGKGNSHLYRKYIPITFLLLWLVSFIVVLVSKLNITKADWTIQETLGIVFIVVVIFFPIAKSIYKVVVEPESKDAVKP